MATFFTDYSQPQNQTSLSDMINTARGIQSYQQAQQINPLAVRKQQADTSLAEGTLQPNIQKAEEVAKQAVITTASNKYALDLKQQEDFSKILGGFAYDTRLTPESLLKDPNGSLDVMHEIRVAGKAAGIPEEKLATITAPGLHTAMKNPTEFPRYLANMASVGMTSEERRSAYQPKVSTTPEGRTITTTPQLGAQAPQVNFGVAGNVQTGAEPITGASMGNAFNPDAAVPLPHPIRKAGTQYLPDPTEGIDTAAGAKYRQDLLGHLNNTAEINRNLNETFSAITKLNPDAWYRSGVAGTVVRNLSNLVGSSDYLQLNKDLANLQLSQLAAQGGSMQTDAAKSLQARASGSETYNPDVLLNIVKRTAAKQTELQLQAPAAQLASQKFGDNNAAKFQQEWSKNADSKVFEAMNINNAVQNPIEKKKAIDELLGRDPKARALFLKKYDNINKLIQTGSL